MKLLFDECIPLGIYRSIVPALNAANPAIRHDHMITFMGLQGAKDDIWITRARDEDWIIITGDSGRRCDGPPLHLLMPQFAVTGVFFSGKLQQKNHKTRSTRFS